jgi:N-methylhydantoinase A/oxoprolinase/acetone carboxylase beta subunit
MIFAGVPEGGPAPVYRRADLLPGFEIPGPAGIDQVDTTIVVSPGWSAVVRPDRTLELQRRSPELS